METLTQNLTTSKNELELTTGGAASLLAIRDAIGDLVPEMTDRAHRDPFFRESLVEDSRITIEALLAGSSSTVKNIPDYVSVSVREDSAQRMHLLIPQPYAGVVAANEPNALMNVLVQASTDPYLQQELLSEPKATLERELSKLLGEIVTIPSALDVVVVPQAVNELVIVIPARPLDTVSVSPIVEEEFEPDYLNGIEVTSSCYSCQCWSADCYSKQCYSADCYSYSRKC